MNYLLVGYGKGLPQFDLVIFFSCIGIGTGFGSSNPSTNPPQSCATIDYPVMFMRILVVDHSITPLTD